MPNSPPTPKARVATGGFFSSPKLSNTLALLVILFSSTQLGFHFWPASALVYGIRVDYLSPVVYFLDLLIILYLLISPKIPNTKYQILNTILPILLANLLFSQNPLSTLSWSLHFILYLSFIISLSPRLITVSYFLLPIGMAFQVALAGLQVALGHTLQGVFYYLGERALSVGTPNVARGEVFGQTALRAYGTFSHPNILAGWLVVSLLILIHLTRRQKLLSFVLYLSTVLTVLGVIITQSRTAALSLFGLVIPLYLLKSLRPRLLYSVLLIIVIWLLVITGVYTRSVDTSLPDRLHLQGLSLKVVRAYPIFGTGASASISTYPALSPTTRLLQPDHNSFTLFLSWFGLLGTLAILFLFRSRLITYSFFLIPLFPLLLLDHYLLTSPQGLFILILYLRTTQLLSSPRSANDKIAQ